MTYEVRDRLREIDRDVLRDGKGLPARNEKSVRRPLRPFADRFAPVVVHADAVPKNALQTEDGGQVLVEAFSEGYGDSVFDLREPGMIVRALHIIRAADSLSFYFGRKDSTAFRHTETVLSALI